MFCTKLISILGLLSAALVSGPALAAQDSPGTEDHPLVSRYEGSVIDGQQVLNFVEHALPVGPAKKNAAGQPYATKSISLEGNVTRTLYRGPVERTTLEIQSNYRKALKDAGFEILYSCAGDECGRLFHWIFYHEMGQRIRTTETAGSAFDIPQDLRYVAAKGVIGDSVFHVAVLTAFDAGFSDLSKQPVTLVEVVEAEAMETGMVTIDAEAMAKGLDADGFIALYGIYFDTNSSDIKTESAPALVEIQKLLQMRPKLKLLVVGHTDNQGDYDYNMGLSGRRANSVTRSLTSDYGVEGARLRSAGVGFLAPVATNDFSQGRSLNRRVVLVKQ